MIHSHWSVENQLHWPLDLALHEHASRTHADPARRIGLKSSRFKAALNDAYLRSIILGVRT